MTQQYTCTINLIVLGPFLTAATGPERYGVDKSAHRDHMGRLVIPASHIKGKLRSSLEELDPFSILQFAPILGYSLEQKALRVATNRSLLRFISATLSAPIRSLKEHELVLV